MERTDNMWVDVMLQTVQQEAICIHFAQSGDSLSFTSNSFGDNLFVSCLKIEIIVALNKEKSVFFCHRIDGVNQ